MKETETKIQSSINQSNSNLKGWQILSSSGKYKSSYQRAMKNTRWLSYMQSCQEMHECS